MLKVFLAGTENSVWRNNIKSKLKIGFVDPVGNSAFTENRDLESIEKNQSDFVLYVITPRMIGFIDIAKVVDESNKISKKVLFCFLEKDEEKEFSKFQIKSLNAVGKMVKTNGGQWFANLDEVTDYLISLNKQ